jgi:hypothetical protein
MSKEKIAPLLYKAASGSTFCQDCAENTTMFDLIDGWLYWEDQIDEIVGITDDDIYFCDGCNGEIKSEERKD